jgi:hypothetical protein
MFMRYSVEDEHARALRRVRASVCTLYNVVEDLDDPEEIQRRADLLIAVEDLADVTQYLLERTREIAWQDVAGQGEEHYE